MDLMQEKDTEESEECVCKFTPTKPNGQSTPENVSVGSRGLLSPGSNSTDGSTPRKSPRTVLDSSDNSNSFREHRVNRKLVTRSGSVKQGRQSRSSDTNGYSPSPVKRRYTASRNLQAKTQQYSSDSEDEEEAVPRQLRKRMPKPPKLEPMVPLPKSDDQPSPPVLKAEPIDATSPLTNASSEKGEELLVAGLSKTKYDKRMQDSLALYKMMSNKDNGERPIYQSFLIRNLCYVKAYKHRSIPRYEIGFTEPPRMWPMRSRTRRQEKTLKEKKVNIKNILEILKTRIAITQEIEEKYKTESHSFSLAVLADYALYRKEQALFSDFIYRSKRQITRRKKMLPAYKVIARREEREGRIESTKFISPVKGVTILFHDIYHQLLFGQRTVQFTVFLITQRGDKYDLPRKVTGATFTMHMTGCGVKLPPRPPVAIDLPPIPVKVREDVDSITMFLVVEIGLDTQAITIDGGRCLRRTKARGGEVECEPLVPRLTKDKIEHAQTLWGCKIIWEKPHSTLTHHNDGFILFKEGSCQFAYARDVPVKITNNQLIPQLLSALRADTMPWCVFSVVNDYVPPPSGQALLPVVAPCPAANGSMREISPAPSLQEKNLRHTFLESYLGEFDGSGYYQNDWRAIEAVLPDGGPIEVMFTDMNSTGRSIRRALNLKPKTVKYRMLQNFKLEAPNDFSGPKEDLSPFEKKKRIDEGEILTMTSPTNCIICDRKFPNFFALMMHCYTSYPRISFIIKLVTEETEDDATVVDVFLNPNHLDFMEIQAPRHNPGAADELITWFVTPDHARTLRRHMRMDLTLFIYFLEDPLPIRDEDIRRERFIHPSLGRFLSPHEQPDEVDVFPYPGADLLTEISHRNIYDFIDVTLECKKFMATFNMMQFRFGQPRCRKIGVYMLYKFYIKLHFDFIQREGPEFKEIIRNYINVKFLQKTSDLLYAYQVFDLWQRMEDNNYDPIRSKQESSLHMFMRPELHKGYMRFRNAMEKCNNDESVRRNFPKVYKTDPFTLKGKEWYETIEEALRTVIPKKHYVQYLVADPFTHIFEGGVIPNCFYKNLEKVFSDTYKSRR